MSLDATAFEELPEWEITFGEAFPLALADITPDTTIPGFIIFSGRATPLSAWMSGLEMGYLQLEVSSRSILRLETGASDSWILANMINPQILEEAKGFEAAKAKANGVHFLAIQSSPESEAFAGFWLLQQI